MTRGQIIRNNRQRLGLSQAELSAICGLAISTVLDAENENHVPSLSTRSRLQRVLGVNIETGLRTPEVIEADLIGEGHCIETLIKFNQ